MNKLYIIVISSILLIFSACAQTTGQPQGLCVDEKFDAEIASTISFTIPIIGAEDLRNIQEDVYIFDTRKKEEFELSHIPEAIYLGYGDFDEKRLENIPKEAKIVLYCSIGYRSEKIGEKLQSKGYKNVFNLYGSIFEWANRSYPMEDKNGNITKKIHTYNRSWSKWVDGSKAEKVW